MMKTDKPPILFHGAAIRLVAMALVILELAPEVPAQTTSRVSLGSGAVQGNDNSTACGISDNGRYVLITSAASNLIPNDTNAVDDVFLRDRQTGVTTRVSLGTGGVQTNGDSFALWMSADGRYIPFVSYATNLVAGDTNLTLDTFLHDRLTGATSCVSVTPSGVPGNSASYWASISSDGRHIAFHSFASDLVPGDTNGTWDVFVHDRVVGTTARVSLSSTGAQANGECSGPSISADGRFVVFFSTATNLVPDDTNANSDIFVRDLAAGTTERVSVPASGGQTNGYSTFPAISADGRCVAFESEATNLVMPDANLEFRDIYVRDRTAGTTERVSVASDGTQGDHGSERASISADGRYVSYYSQAWNLVSGDTNFADDVFRHDRQTGTTIRVSVAPNGAEIFGAHNQSYEHSMSADGRCVEFRSAASFVAGDDNQRLDCFVRDLGPTFTSFCHGDGTGSACPCGNSGQAGHGCDNSDLTGGAILGYSGAPMPSDSVVLNVAGERTSSLTIFVQGDVDIPAVAFGDGLRCFGGRLKRLYVRFAVNGSVMAPMPNDPTITTRSAALGDQIPPGATRYYMTYYRDAEAGFCPSPVGNTFNSSNGLAIVW